MNLEFIVKLLEKYWHKRTSKTGLFFGLTILFLVLFVISQLVHPLLKDAGFITDDQAGNQFYDSICLMVFFACGVIYFIIWLVWRQILIPHDNAIIVIFAPWAEDDHQDVVRRLYKQFNVELAARGLGKQVHAKLLPPEETVLNNEDVNRIMRERNARLVIFGRVAKGSLKGKKTEGFSEISFSIRHKIAPEDTHLLASSFSIEDFQVLDENSFLHSHFASDNLSNCACAFIGIGLTAEGNFDTAKQIWQNLFQKSKAKANTAIANGAASIKHAKFSQFVSRWYQWNEYCWMVNYYNQNLVGKLTSRSGDEFALACEQRLKFISELNPKSPDYLHFQAILQFHRGDTRGALHTIEEIEKIMPKGISAMFSRAFLTLWQRKYKPALRHFKQLAKLNCPPPPFVLSVITFYDALGTQYPDRHELKFGSAFVNDFFCDQKIARENYESFLNIANSAGAYAPLDAYASERLLVLQSQSAVAQ
jgi:hypothetical protein